VATHGCTVLLTKIKTRSYSHLALCADYKINPFRVPLDVLLKEVLKLKGAVLACQQWAWSLWALKGWLVTVRFWIQVHVHRGLRRLSPQPPTISFTGTFILLLENDFSQRDISIEYIQEFQ